MTGQMSAAAAVTSNTTRIELCIAHLAAASTGFHPQWPPGTSEADCTSIRACLSGLISETKAV